MNNKLLVNERQSDIGNFMVGRLLPFRKKRQVGPFTFIDHMGPTSLGPVEYMDVDQHPHIGLSTLTYLFEGEIHHKDSTGSDQIIYPGDVGFMTAGKAVTHTERTPAFRRDGTQHRIHGYQIWVALPKHLEGMKPQFDYFTAQEVPTWQSEGVTFKLAAGNAFGKKSPLQGFSPLFMVDIYARNASKLQLHGQIEGEVAFVIVKGTIINDGQTIEAGQMLISKTDDECEICLSADTQLMLFGGKPLPEERFLSWNFVSHSKEILAKAKIDWEAKSFPTVPGDATYIPFPKMKK